MSSIVAIPTLATTLHSAPLRGQINIRPIPWSNYTFLAFMFLIVFCLYVQDQHDAKPVCYCVCSNNFKVTSQSASVKILVIQDMELKSQKQLDFSFECCYYYYYCYYYFRLFWFETP